MRHALDSGGIPKVCSVHAHDHLVAIVASERDVKRRLHSGRGQLRQFECDRAGARLVSPAGVRHGGQDVVPVLRPLTLAHGVSHAVREIQRELHLPTPHRRGKAELRRRAGDPVVLAVTELVRLSIWRSQFKHRRARAHWRPSQRAELLRLAGTHRHGEFFRREIALKGRAATGQLLRKERP